MARYEREFAGMPGVFTESRGLDPNYRGEYRGMRMEGGYGRAAYGAHRFNHQDDLATEGGYHGIGGRIRGDLNGGRGYDARWRDWDDSHFARNRSRALLDFNSRGEIYAAPRPRGRYDEGFGRGERSLPDRSWSPRREYRGGYANRGIADAGFSEGWGSRPGGGR